jgi:ATP-dependent Lon protease
MESEFITYQKFNDIALANELAELLEQHSIIYRIEEDSLTFNPSFALNDELSKEYAVKISAGDFEQVNELLKQDASENIDAAEKDYYLFDFTDEELKDVIAKADEWNAFDVQLARKLLAERGKAVSDDEIAAFEEKRIEELKVTEPSQTGWIVIGYLFALLGGLLGLFIGWYLKSSKKTLPNGERVYEYSERDRWHGAVIFYISVVALILSVIYRVTREIN